MQRTFGEEATAILTGWRWSIDHAAYIRLTGMGDRIRVEAAEAGAMVEYAGAIKQATQVSAVIEWWQSNVILRLIDRLEQARGWQANIEGKKPIQGYECWHVDAQGKTIED